MAATIQAPTYTDLFNTGKAEAIDRQSALTFDEGDAAEMYMAAGAAMADGLTAYASARVKETFLDGASGDALTELADDRYGIQRLQATAATGTVTLTRASGVLTGTLAAGTVFATPKDASGVEQQFVLLAPLGWSAGVLTQNAAVQALTDGTGGNVAAGTVTRIISTGLFDTFTVTNAARMAGGTEQEKDDALRQRCRDFFATLRRGTKAALEFGAKQVAGVSAATAEDLGTGIVTVYVSDATGSSSPTMVAAVQAELENWRAAGIPLSVVGAVLYSIPGGIVVALTTRAGVSTAAIATDIKNAIVARVNKLKIGESLSPTLIKNAVATVDPDGILEVTVSNPVGTVSPGSNGLIRVSVGDITVS